MMIIPVAILMCLCFVVGLVLGSITSEHNILDAVRTHGVATLGKCHRVVGLVEVRPDGEYKWRKENDTKTVPTGRAQ